ncbi:hypothetical protein [Mycolicibacterium palauense]|uniref:hypothetical protein n=1 Tax=Mycolicibacterium palauense TaxID=2034511 RepID=UPI00114568D5|nr:hypothetical protein [Mycolicibacterium palauense]
MAINTEGPWVDVVFLQGDDYDEIADMGIDEMAAHMAQWDDGQETDYAHTREVASWGSDDRLYEVNVDGIDYVMSANYGLGYASLNRRPLG